MSRCRSLYHALANASSSSCGWSRTRFVIAAYAGSVLSARSVVSIITACFFDGSCASGTVATVDPFAFGDHCLAPAGLFVSSHSWPYKFSRKLLSHFVGLVVQAPSKPLVIV